MAKKTVRKLSDLPQVHDTFLYVSTLMHTWITPPAAPPVRPYAGLVASAETGMVRAVQVYSAEPTAQEARDLLIQAMRKPGNEGGKPGRPDAIAVVDRNLIEPLQGLLEEAGVKISVFPVERPAELDAMIRDLEEHLRGEPEMPGLLSVQGVTPELVGEFFAAASEFYEAAPWDKLSNYDVLAIRRPEDREDRYSFAMGGIDGEYGLMTFDHWEDVVHQFQVDDATEQDMPEEGMHALYYVDMTLMPFDDVDAINQYNWPVNDEEAYPIPVIVKPDESVERPSQHELLWYIVALRAIPEMVNQLKMDRDGEYKPFDKTIRVKGYDGEADVRVSYDPFRLDPYLPEVSDEEMTVDEGLGLIASLAEALAITEGRSTGRIPRKSGASKKATKTASKKSAPKKPAGKKTAKKTSTAKKRSHK